MQDQARIKRLIDKYEKDLAIAQPILDRALELGGKFGNIRTLRVNVESPKRMLEKLYKELV